MSVPVAYLSVILIWTTTPLAIAWSSEGGDHWFAVAARMVIGALVVFTLVVLLRVRMPWHRDARITYLASGLGIFGAMSLVYWAAQRIPSGWISVVFGLSPIVTGLMARAWLRGAAPASGQWLGMLMGVAGLAVMLLRPDGPANTAGASVVGATGAGILAMVASVCVHSASAVWVKRHSHDLSGMAVTAGGLSVAVPLFLLMWFLNGAAGTGPQADWPALSARAWTALLYLAVVGTGIGFALYFYVLRELDPVRAALITLVTPASALWLGHLANGEPVDAHVLSGSALILAGLAAFQWSAWRGRGARPAG